MVSLSSCYWRSYEGATLLISAEGASLEKCKAEARQVSIDQKCAVIFIHNGRAYMWRADDKNEPRLEEMN